MRAVDFIVAERDSAIPVRPFGVGPDSALVGFDRDQLLEGVKRFTARRVQVSALCHLCTGLTLGLSQYGDRHAGHCFGSLFSTRLVHS